MKIDKLIEELESIRKEYGNDINVKYDSAIPDSDDNESELLDLEENNLMFIEACEENGNPSVLLIM